MKTLLTLALLMFTPFAFAGGGDVDPEPPDDCTPNGCNPQICGGMNATCCGHMPLFWCYDGAPCICGGTCSPPDTYVCWCYCAKKPIPGQTEGDTRGGPDTLRLRITGPVSLATVLDALQHQKGSPFRFDYTDPGFGLAQTKARHSVQEEWNVSSSDWLIRDLADRWGLKATAIAPHRYLIDVKE